MIFSGRDLTRLLLPLIIEQLLNVLVGMVDVLMVAAVGEAAVSGVSLVDSVSILAIQILAALATGGAVVCSQYIGKKAPQQACQAAGQLVVITIGGAALFTVAALAGGRNLLRVIFGSVEPAVMDNALIYFRLTSLSFPFLGLYNSCAALYRSMGNSRISMMTSLVMNGMNVVGNGICIYGLHMGVEGVAIPTLVSRVFAALLMAWLIRSPQNVIRVTGLEDLRLRPDMIRRILSVGIPSGLENGMFQFGKVTLQSLVSTLGTASIAGYAVASNLVMFLYLPGNALGLGLITIVGQCIGAGEFEQAKKYTRRLIAADYGFLLVIGMVLGFGSTFLVSLYNLSPEASRMAEALIIVHCLAMVIWPPSFLLPNALRAGLDARFTMMISVFSMWLFRIGFAWLFVRVFRLGVLGVWYGMFIDWLFRGIVFLVRFKGFTKRVRQV